MRLKNKTLVLIPHYNDPEELKATIASIGDESIDILVVDDGSFKIFLEEVIISVAKNNGDIFFEYLKENKGIECALNEGLNFAIENNYNFIARLDVGDYCINSRFQKQETFLNNHKNIGIVGSYVEFFNENKTNSYCVKLPLKHKEIKQKMYINSMFIHPSVMFRVECLKKVGLYPYGYVAAEDLAFFFNFLEYYKGANIPEILVRCKLSTTGISGKKRKQQVLTRIKIILQNFHLGFYPVYGLIRNYLLYITPYSFIKFLKFKLLKNEN